MSLLTEELVQEAIELALPTVRVLCKRYTWGPQGVVIGVAGKGLAAPYIYAMEELGPEDKWDSSFYLIVAQKLQVSSRTGRTSHSVVSDKPWLLEEEDSFYRGGVAEDEGLAVAASGSHGEIDEVVAWIVFNLIAGLCQMKLKELRDQNINHL